MFEDYRQAVLRDYQQKKVANRLHGDLAYPTAAKLQKECLRVFESRFIKKDTNTLGTNFGPQAEAAAYRLAIKKYPVDKLKPLATWLKGETNTRDENKVELLAWLTDFEPRPYQADHDYTTEAASSVVKPSIAREATIAAKPVAESEKRSANNLKKWTPWLAGLLVALATIYFAVRPPGLTGKEQCMYWAGDHYQPAACNEKVEGLVALDLQKTAHFKKIDRNQLSYESLGKVWYVKIGGIIEFYTDSGFHPTHPEKRLLPLTSYILNKYIYNITDRHEITQGLPKNDAGTRYIEVSLNINADDKVLVNGEAATTDEISDKPNTLKLVEGKHYRIKINNCPEQEIVPTKNTVLSVCM